MNIDSPSQTILLLRRGPCPPGEWCIASTTKTNTPMQEFNNPEMDPDKEGVNPSHNILGYEEPKCDRQARSRLNANV
jgi:hypothetical protein